MGKNKTPVAVVVDANIIVSALIKYGGYTAKVLRLAGEYIDLYAPKELVEDVKKHVDLISKKSGLTREEIELVLRILLKRISIKEPEGDLSLAESLVNDPKDAQYVLLALDLSKEYTTVVILTYNTKDFKEKRLQEMGIAVMTPPQIHRRLQAHHPNDL